jgi:hypothetical protein
MNHGAQANGQKPLRHAFDLKFQFVLLLRDVNLIMTPGTLVACIEVCETPH